MRVLNVFCQSGRSDATIRLESTSGLIRSSVGGSMRLINVFAMGLNRAGSIVFGTPRQASGALWRVTGSVVYGS